MNPKWEAILAAIVIMMMVAAVAGCTVDYDAIREVADGISDALPKSGTAPEGTESTSSDVETVTDPFPLPPLY